MAVEAGQLDVDARTRRAATEHMTVVEEGRGLFEVTTASGSAYTVDLRENVCSCADSMYRNPAAGCKHLRRVKMEVGQVNLDQLEARLAATADDLEAEANDLTRKAQELEETADEFRRARARLGVVTR